MASDGRLISPTIFFPFPFENVDWIRQFRVIQDSRRKLVVQIVAKDATVDQSRVVECAGRRLREFLAKICMLSSSFSMHYRVNVPENLGRLLRAFIGDMGAFVYCC